MGSSPNRVSGKETEICSAQGVRSTHGGTESAGNTRIPDRSLGFRKAPVPDPLSEDRIPPPDEPETFHKRTFTRR